MSLFNDPVHAVPTSTRLRKSRRRWRVAAFVALAVAVVVLAGGFAVNSAVDEDDHIARITVNGLITTNATRLKIIESLADNDRVKAVIVDINSGGGTTAGGEELFEALGRLRAEKPVTAVISEVGASAAYMTAIASDRIFARRLSIVGSIGVLMQHVNAGRLLDTIGIEFDKVQTGPLKAEPDFDEPLVGAPRASLQALVDDSYEWFVDIVAERRNLSRTKTLELADGRIVTGRMALTEGLIDAIGGEVAAQAWLEEDRDVAADLKIVTHYPLPEGDFDRILDYLGSRIQSSIGLGAGNGVVLDGLVSLWQVE